MFHVKRQGPQCSMEGALFSTLSEQQCRQLEGYADLLLRFNRRINLVSREDEAHLKVHHIAHCLALTARAFPPRSAVVDWGAGGGLPAIPLAIAFPEVTVYAVDASGKKVQAVRAMARRIGLDNLYAWNGRAEHWPGTVHYSVSRATAPLADLWGWHLRVACSEVPEALAGAWAPGLVCLKGGDLRHEVQPLRRAFPNVVVNQYPIQQWISDDYFADKYVVAVENG